MLEDDTILFDQTLASLVTTGFDYPPFGTNVKADLVALQESPNISSEAKAFVRENPILGVMWFKYSCNRGWPLSYAVAQAEEGVEAVLSQLLLPCSRKGVSALRKLKIDTLDTGGEEMVAELLRSPRSIQIFDKVVRFRVWHICLVTQLPFLNPKALGAIVTAGADKAFCSDLIVQVRQYVSRATFTDLERLFNAASFNTLISVLEARTK